MQKRVLVYLLQSTVDGERRKRPEQAAFSDRSFQREAWELLLQEVHLAERSTVDRYPLVSLSLCRSTVHQSTLLNLTLTLFPAITSPCQTE